MKNRVDIAGTILEEVVGRLTEAAGIDPDLLDAGRIGWTIESRRRRLALRDPGAYLTHLRSSSEELEHLIDALVIQETRFFRDHAVFEQIRIWAGGAVAGGRQTLRILCAPCSTGQEAYSVAAILRVSGVPLSDFSIDAFDISRTALSAAQRGIYPAGALEHVQDELRCMCGELRNEDWRIHDDLRARIRFERRNLAVPDALDDESGYDLVLCRNLFIYLHAQARAILADSLSRALRPGGRLIIGTGDRVPELNSRFVALKPAAGFAFTHKSSVTLNRRDEVPKVPEAVVVRRRTNWEPPPELERAAGTATEFYQRALEYSQCGNLRQAERRCRQALYLDPSYVPALELLYSLWQVHPSARLRRALQVRIRRIRSGSDSALREKGMA
jgi:chemotaxis protein methyltransferase WspC